MSLGGFFPSSHLRSSLRQSSPQPIPFNFLNSQWLPLLVSLECPPCPPAQHLWPTQCPLCHSSGVYLVSVISWAHSVSSIPFSHCQRRNNWSSSGWNVSSFYLHGYSSTWKLNIHLEEMISSWSKVLRFSHPFFYFLVFYWAPSDPDPPGHRRYFRSSVPISGTVLFCIFIDVFPKFYFYLKTNKTFGLADWNIP